jgi:cytochrome c-type biogenesis protein CcmH/NrfF
MRVSRTKKINIFILLIFSLAFSVYTHSYGVSRNEILAEAQHFISPDCPRYMTADHCSQPIAIQIRKEISQLLSEGKDREAIKDWMIERYGENVLSYPRPKGFQLIAWIIPFLVLAIALIGVVFFIRKHLVRANSTLAKEISNESEEKNSKERLKRELKDFI